MPDSLTFPLAPEVVMTARIMRRSLAGMPQHLSSDRRPCVVAMDHGEDGVTVGIRYVTEAVGAATHADGCERAFVVADGEQAIDALRVPKEGSAS